MSFAYSWKKGRADYSRKRLGNLPLTQTAEKVLKLLKEGGFKATISGGYAVQHHGYPRFTEDIDIIVDRRNEANEYLSIRGFKETSSLMVMYDRENGIEINLLQSGAVLSPKSLPTPEPKEDILDLPELISNKLSSYFNNKGKRAKDLGDVSELIQRNQLPRDFQVHPEYQKEYEELWDSIQSDHAVIS